MDESIPIGRFGRMSGLTVEALRHYDEIGLLRPASVDPDTGYRRYRPEQLEDARRIGWLRQLDVPLGRVAAYLAAGTADKEHDLLRRHLAGIDARTARLQHIAHRLRRAIDAQEGPLMTTTTELGIDRAARRQLAIDLFNHVWELLETTDRTVEQDDEMIHAAHASRYHWGEVGEPQNLSRGEWQCSRVYAVLGRPEPALHHARRTVGICEAHGIGDWDIASAWEAMARASAVAGDHAARDAALLRARTALDAITDPEDRRIIEADLDGLSREAGA